MVSTFMQGHRGYRMLRAPGSGGTGVQKFKRFVKTRHHLSTGPGVQPTG